MPSARAFTGLSVKLAGGAPQDVRAGGEKGAGLAAATGADGDAPDFAKLIDVVTLGLLGGRGRTEADWNRLLSGAGFTLDRVIPGRPRNGCLAKRQGRASPVDPSPPRFRRR